MEEKTQKSPERLKIIEKIAEHERLGLWDKDVEDDPETIVLTPDKVDYLGKKLSSRIGSFFANRAAVKYYENEIKKGDFVIKAVNGIENYLSVNGGAVITCNHFSVYDNYAVYRAIRNYLPKGHRLYKVIREGNYTNFGGLYGYFFRHCNTLPLSSHPKTMMNFMQAVDELLTRGEKILIYPEQAMWWNYRKPRPLKSGAFRLAVKSKVPIIPAFITMEDTDRLDANGFNIQAYTVWFLPPIYRNEGLSDKENAEYLKNKNYEIWKDLYEKVYGIPLKYGE
ncbi:MAG: 1-acyl-sn-glycerol-3-phosphate acyltransferase [Clostridia bacterium]|nr:1-acyl-sn-glycerol-3-phosphate acyltransferase [Clostridia bacterium]